MLRLALGFTIATGLAMAAFGVIAAPVHKCIVNGTVTYQQDACPSDQIRKPPDIQELNAAEKRRRAAAKTAAATTPAAGAASTAGNAGTAAISPAKVTSSDAKVHGNFSCDGRKFCSQMKSCAEASYFLANCPGVKMDGDKNGIPCEQQWCGR